MYMNAYKKNIEITNCLSVSIHASVTESACTGILRHDGRVEIACRSYLPVREDGPCVIVDDRVLSVSAWTCEFSEIDTLMTR